MLVSRSGLSPVMVGRDEELAVLRRLLATPGPPEPSPRIVTISGDAGVGKSRLLREALLAASPDAVIMAAQAEEGDLSRPFELVREALAGRADLLPAYDDTHALDELLRAAVDTVVGVTGGAPLVLAFEDLHWADAESIAVFGRLALHADLDAILIGTFRPEDFDRRHPLAALLADLDRQRSVHHLELRGLTADDLARMMQVVYGKAVSQRAVEALHRRTQGNPFFVEELLDPSCCLDPEELATVRLPWNVTEAVLRKVDTLEDEPRRVLDAAAVLGARVSFDLLAAVTECAEADLIRHLRALVAGGLLVEDEADVFTFRHALTREAVADAMLGREQRRLHERALDEMRAMGSTDHADLARHAFGARRLEEVVALAREGAARYLRESSMSQALTLAEMGLSEAPDDRELLEIAARASFELAMTDESERHADAWHRLAVKDGDVAAESAALRQLAITAWLRNDLDRYRSLVEEALSVSESLGPSIERCWALAYKSQMEMLVRPTMGPMAPADPADPAITWAEAALALIDEVGCHEIRPYVLVNLGTVLAESVDREAEGLALLRQAYREALDRNDSVTIGRALNNLLSHLLYSGGDDDPLPLLEEADAETTRRGLDVVKPKLHASWLQWAQLGGDYDRAVLEVERGLRRGDDQVEVHAFANVDGHLALERGDRAAAEAALERSLQLAAGNVTQRPWAQLLALHLAADDGDADASAIALADLETALGEAGPTFAHEWGEREATGALDALRGGVASHLVRSFLAATVPEELWSSPERAAWLAHAEAALLEAEGDHAGAAAAYRRSLAAPRPPRAAIWRAEASMGLARSLLAAGDRTGATGAARDAVTLLDRWPGPRRARADALLRRLATGSGPGEGELTGRETEVLLLIADGLTNREIADRLYISIRTAGVHVSNILAKTGTSSRTEAAAWARRKGLLGDT